MESQANTDAIAIQPIVMTCTVSKQLRYRVGCKEIMHSEVRFRELDFEDESLEGYWVGTNGEVWSCWTRKGCGGKWILSGELIKKLATQGQDFKEVRVSLRGEKKFSVSRLVYAAFIGPLTDSDSVRFINGNHLDCSVENLCKQHLAKKSIVSDAIVASIKSGNSVRSIAKAYGLSRDVVKRLQRKLSNGIASS